MLITEFVPGVYLMVGGPWDGRREMLTGVDVVMYYQKPQPIPKWGEPLSEVAASVIPHHYTIRQWSAEGKFLSLFAHSSMNDFELMERLLEAYPNPRDRLPASPS